jgi:hypothetical protein
LRRREVARQEAVRRPASKTLAPTDTRAIQVRTDERISPRWESLNGERLRRKAKILVLTLG